MRVNFVSCTVHKTHKIRYAFYLLLLTAFFTTAAVAVFSFAAAWKLTHPPRSELQPITANVLPDYRPVSFTDFTKTTTLYGWYFEVKNSGKTVIMVHGYRSNRLQFGENTSVIVKEMMKKGYNVLLFDQRNSGLSQGKLSTLGYKETDDILGAIRFAKAENSTKIALAGFSTGACASLIAAARSPEVSAVIADSPFNQPGDFSGLNGTLWRRLPAFPFDYTVPFAAKLSTGTDLQLASPDMAIGKLANKPALYIISKGDKVLRRKNSLKLYQEHSKLSKDSAVLWEPNNSGHASAFSNYPEEYMARVIDFIDKHMSAAAKK